jgi:hypothetical protein
MTLAVVIFAMFVFVYLHNGVFDYRQVCHFCGGRRRHGKKCPHKGDE